MKDDFKTVLIIALNRGDFYNLRAAIQYMTELYGVFMPRVTTLGEYGGDHYNFSDKLFIDLVDMTLLGMNPHIIMGIRYDYMIGADHMLCLSSPPRLAEEYIKFDGLHELFEGLIKRPSYDKKEPLTPDTFAKCLEDRYPGIQLVDWIESSTGNYVIQASVSINGEYNWRFGQTYSLEDQKLLSGHTMFEMFISNLNDHYIQFTEDQINKKLKECKEKY